MVDQVFGDVYVVAQQSVISDWGNFLLKQRIQSNEHAILPVYIRVCDVHCHQSLIYSFNKYTFIH